MFGDDIQPELKTQVAYDGPRKPPDGGVIATTFANDHIEDIAERIMSLSPSEVRHLRSYVLHCIRLPDPSSRDS